MEMDLASLTLTLLLASLTLTLFVALYAELVALNLEEEMDLLTQSALRLVWV